MKEIEIFFEGVISFSRMNNYNMLGIFVILVVEDLELLDIDLYYLYFFCRCLLHVSLD